MLTYFKVKILPLYVSRRKSVLSSLETRNGTGSIRKESNIRYHSPQAWRGESEEGPQPDKYFSHTDARCPCPEHWIGVSTVPLSFHVTDGKEKPRELPSNCCFLGSQFFPSHKTHLFLSPQLPSLHKQVRLLTFPGHCWTAFPKTH